MQVSDVALMEVSIIYSNNIINERVWMFVCYSITLLRLKAGIE